MHVCVRQHEHVCVHVCVGVGVGGKGVWVCECVGACMHASLSVSGKIRDPVDGPKNKWEE